MDKQLTKDRNYYRMLTNEELLALAKSVKTTELELVLAERLKILERQITC